MTEREEKLEALHWRDWKIKQDPDGYWGIWSTQGIVADFLTEQNAQIIMMALLASEPRPTEDKLKARIAELEEVLERLLVSAKMLQANSEGCAQNHFPDDYQHHGCPAWLWDTQRDITQAHAALRKSET